MSLRNNLLSEFLIIMAIIIIGYIAGWQEVKLLLQNDIGMVMALIGVLWSFGAFLKPNAMSEAVVSIVIGVGLIIFGLSLHSAGLGYALLITGVYALIANGFVRDVASVGGIIISNGTLTICALISIGSIIVGYPIRNITPKTDNRPEYYQPIENTNLECRVDIDIYNEDSISISTRTVIPLIRGSEESIYKQAYSMLRQTRLKASEVIEWVNVIPTKIPPGAIPSGKERFMGLSTQTLKCTYDSEHASPFHSYFSNIENHWH